MTILLTRRLLITLIATHPILKTIPTTKADIDSSRNIPMFNFIRVKTSDGLGVLLNRNNWDVVRIITDDDEKRWIDGFEYSQYFARDFIINLKSYTELELITQISKLENRENFIGGRIFINQNNEIGILAMYKE